MAKLAWTLVVILGIMAFAGAQPALSLGLASLFVFGAIGFWALLILCLIVMTYNSDDSDSGNATATLFLSLLLFQLLSDFKPFNYIKAHPLDSLGIAGGYIVAGFLWSLKVKWYYKAWGMKAKYVECREAFFKKNKIEGVRVPDELLKAWDEEVSRKRVRKPEAKDHKLLIVGWMCYWPFSVVWTLLKDWMRKIFDHIYLRLRFLYETVANKAYKDTEDDFRKPMTSVSVSPASVSEKSDGDVGLSGSGDEV